MKKQIVKGFLGVLGSALLFSSCGWACKTAETKVAEETRTVDLVIVANVTVMPEYQGELVAAFQKVVEGTRQEPGNVSYVVFQNVNDSLKYTFIEEWESQAAIDAHNASAHFQEFAKAVEGKAALEVNILRKKF